MRWQMRDALLLPDSSRWGRGYGGNAYTSQELGETRGYIQDALAAGKGFPGYERRGLLRQAGFLATNEFVFAPPGFDADHPGRKNAPDPLLLEPNNPTTESLCWRMPEYLVSFYRASGVTVDQHGRWVHPHSAQIIEADIPICTGYGVGYEGGETVVVDVVVEDGDHVLFNTRQDNGKTIPSLVGGYTWPTDYTSIENWRVGKRPITREGIFGAVRRIVAAKTGVKLPDDAKLTIAWGIRPWSSAHTLNFGTLTYTVLVQLSKGASRTLNSPRDDAFWQSKLNITSVVSGLWPDHHRGFEACMS